MSTAEDGSLLPGFIVLAALGGILWVALGRPGRAGSQKRRTRGHRARYRGAMPRRDASFSKGTVLTAAAVVVLARVISTVQTSLLAAAVGLGLVAAVGLVIAPHLTRTGVGFVGIAALVIDRVSGVGYGAQAPTMLQNALWLALALGMIGTVLALRLVATPVRVLSGAAAGLQDRARTGSSLPLMLFGALDLLGFVLQPSVVIAVPQDQPAHAASLLGLLLLVLAIVAVGMALLPNFTLSVVGLGVLAGNVLLLPLQGTSPNAPLVFLIVAALLAGAVRLAGRQARIATL